MGAMGMQPVAATAGYGIIQRKLQIVVAQKPVECRPSFVAPAAVASHSVRFETGRNRACSFNWLLIEARLFATFAIEPLRPNRYKVAVDFAVLCFQEPIERFEAGGNHTIIGACRSHEH